MRKGIPALLLALAWSQPAWADRCLQGAWRTQSCPAPIYQGMETAGGNRVFCVCLEDFAHLRQPLDRSDSAAVTLRSRELERLSASYQLEWEPLQKLLRMSPDATVPAP
ncbi:hypothetical protein [Ferrimonas marina]|uniref:Uncharacterized protein n=1 Tax=Ferrimonas marina TaxID=299255 RepID=A0A1M5VVG1_9GAMM|nr:hypothetical protein [Ferrimonas marina]SHH79188.1 hypothetical protein SAMN02745129_3010 [Ferrimonas marina]